MLDEGFGDGEAFFPSSRECGSLGFEVGETCDAERGPEPLFPFRFGYAGAMQGCFDDAADGAAGGKLGILLNVGHAQVFARRDFAEVGLDFAGDHLEQRGLAASVRADEPDAVSFIDREGDFAEERRSPEGFGYGLGVEQQIQSVLLLSRGRGCGEVLVHYRDAGYPNKH